MPPLAIVSTPGPLPCLTRRRTSPRGADDTRALIYHPWRDVKEVRGIGLSLSKLERADLGRKVALRLKQNGYSGCSAGDTVPYIICSQQDSDNTHSVGIAQRARHPEELKRDPDKWMIDIDYCLSQQGTSPARLAECLGLDSAKFQSRVTESSNQDTSTMLLSVINDEDERYRGCEPLRLSCPSCSGTFDCPPVSSLITSSTSVSDPNDVLCKTLLDDVPCKTRLYVIYVLISM
ncbi:unnamed protein product [Miscanthus lutarioriparius]|uniref:DNA-directed DNA polymerase n=1 Tax=Miscanthus lutarioriparius TaxID=422564 RepID=A0A811Q955_9POAL|nr:unnamed protein product [Miscanthus lutarioriparius]